MRDSVQVLLSERLSIKLNKFYCNQPTILVTFVGTVVVFSATSMLVFASWHVRSKKINTGREGAQLFVGIWVQHGVCQLNVTRIVAYQQNDGRQLQKIRPIFSGRRILFSQMQPKNRLNHRLKGGLECLWCRLMPPL